ncbi:MAG: UDP-2,3-diacylglucosamine diphosphatase [Deltaproteobacteria bacterium]|nr:UDP-2,3-diacylglucosamine diphosphatase [Candidatus Anaeroferrophillacea bacterium]
MSRAVFLADAHLVRPADPAYGDLLTFFAALPADLGHLFILGDFFDFWFGYETVVDVDCIPVLQALAGLADRGVRLWFVEGNHEFHLGPFFTRRLGTHHQQRELFVTLDDLHIYLAHGDHLATAGRLHSLWTALLKGPAGRAILSLAPPALTKKIARCLSAASRKAGGESRGVPEAVWEAAGAKIAAGADAAIIGHFHRQEEREIDLPQYGRKIFRPCRRRMYALGDWATDRTYLEYRDGAFTWRRWTEDCRHRP